MGWKFRRAYFRPATVIGITIFAAGCGGGTAVPSASTQTPSTPVAPTTPGPPANPVPPPTPAPTGLDPMIAQNWEIGPVINGKNYSPGMPLSPTQIDAGWAFDFPLAPGSVHYVTFPYGSLAGKSHIVMHYRVEGDQSVQLHPVCCADMLSMGPTIYFQAQQDDWNTDGKRWWASFKSPSPIKVGEYELDIPLDGAWTSVFKMSAASNPDEFTNAKLNAQRIGFTFGGGDGLGHGVYSDGNARFVVTMFKVE